MGEEERFGGFRSTPSPILSHGLGVNFPPASFVTIIIIIITTFDFRVSVTLLKRNSSNAPLNINCGSCVTPLDVRPSNGQAPDPSDGSVRSNPTSTGSRMALRWPPINPKPKDGVDCFRSRRPGSTKKERAEALQQVVDEREEGSYKKKRRERIREEERRIGRRGAEKESRREKAADL